MAFAYAEQTTWSGRRFVALFGAIAVNVGFLFAISSGLSFKDVFKAPEPLEMVILDTVPQTEAVKIPTPEVHEEGTVTLMIYVLPDGRVGDVRVDKTSGHARLDQAAVTAARKGWRFRPATQGAVAVPSWGRYAVTFKLT